MIGTAMKHLLLFILFIIHMIAHAHDINRAFFAHKVHPARRCYDDCSLTEFNGEF
jgi:hypothetical protein